MKPSLLDRVRYWCAGRISGDVVETELYPAPEQRPAYLADFGANIEEKGAEPMGWEKAP